MGENVTIKEYMELSGYKTDDKDFDITNLDPDCIFIGDVYVVKYKPKYDIRAPFEEQTYLKLKMKNAILLRVGFDSYINISNIKTRKQLEFVKKRLKKNTTFNRDKGIITGSFFKPFAGDQVVLEFKPYEQETKNKQETPKIKRIEKRLFK